MSTARSFLAIALVLIAALTGNARTPASIGEQLSQDNPAVISYLEKLAPEKIGKKLKGIKLSGRLGRVQGRYIRGYACRPREETAHLRRPRQGRRTRLRLDRKRRKGTQDSEAPGDDSGENAYVLSGDIYTFGDVAPGDGIVILSGGTLAWMNSLPN